MKPGIRFARGFSLVALAIAARAATAAPFPPPEALPALVDRLGADAELVLFDEPAPGKQTRVLAAGRVRATAEWVRALLGDPAAYKRAVPSFRRADVVAQRGRELEVSWELEVPLWNLSGKLWLRPVRDGVDLVLAEGDLAPGQLALRVRATADEVLLTVDGRADVRNANWFARRIAARSPFSEPAMTAAAVWVLLRALVLEAERGPTADPRRTPGARPSPPPLGALDGLPLARIAAQLPPGLAAGAVHSRSDGRLDHVEVAVATKSNPGALARAIADPQRWRALPGWRRIKAASDSRATITWDVGSRMPFVDFDAVWSVRPGLPFRALAIGGTLRDAVMGWDAVPLGPRAAVASFSAHPRLDKAGYIPRKFIEAEPLLEQGLSLALAYVDAQSLVKALERGAQGEQ